MDTHGGISWWFKEEYSLSRHLSIDEADAGGGNCRKRPQAGRKSLRHKEFHKAACRVFFASEIHLSWLLAT
jgi:hypothetical protein